MQRVFYACLLLFEFDFARSADINLRDAASEFRKTLLKLLTVIVAVSAFNFSADLIATTLDARGATSTFDDRGLVGINHKFLHLTKVLDRDLVEVDAEILHNGLTTGENREIFEHGLAAIAIAWRLHSADIEHAAQLVDDECAERFARDIFSNDEERLLRFHDLLEEGHELSERIDLIFVDKHERLRELAGHVVGVSYEVRAEVTAIELHTFHDIDGGLA